MMRTPTLFAFLALHNRDSNQQNIYFTTETEFTSEKFDDTYIQSGQKQLNVYK